VADITYLQRVARRTLRASYNNSRNYDIANHLDELVACGPNRIRDGLEETDTQEVLVNNRLRSSVDEYHQHVVQMILIHVRIMPTFDAI